MHCRASRLAAWLSCATHKLQRADNRKGSKGSAASKLDPDQPNRARGCTPHTHPKPSRQSRPCNDVETPITNSRTPKPKQPPAAAPPPRPPRPGSSCASKGPHARISVICFGMSHLWDGRGAGCTRSRGQKKPQKTKPGPNAILAGAPDNPTWLSLGSAGSEALSASLLGGSWWF